MHYTDNKDDKSVPRKIEISSHFMFNELEKVRVRASFQLTNDLLLLRCKRICLSISIQFELGSSWFLKKLR